MSADLHAGALCARHLDGRVPADPPAVLAFHGFIAGEVGFLFNRDGVDIGGGVLGRKGDSFAACLVEHMEKDVAGSRASLLIDEPGEGLNPFRGLLRIIVRDLAEQAIDDGMALV